MKSKCFLIAVLFLLVAIAVVVFVFVSRNNSSPEKYGRVCFRDNCFSTEMARTDTERTRGLMFRESLATDGGMLFVFDREDTYPFWMKNTLIPLDIIWINKSKEVVFIAENVQLCQTEICPNINPNNKAAKYVLEINGGLALKIGLKIGDKADFNFY